MKDHDIEIYADSKRIELDESEILKEIREASKTSTTPTQLFLPEKDLSALAHDNDILAELSKIVLKSILNSEKVQVQVDEPWREVVHQLLDEWKSDKS